MLERLCVYYPVVVISFLSVSWLDKIKNPSQS